MRLKVADLLPGTTYALQVRAAGETGVSEWSERFIFITDQNLLAPVAPLNVTWAVSEDAFVATWSPVTTDVSGGVARVTGYEMEFDAAGTKKYVSVAPQTDNTQSFTLTFAENVALFGSPKPNLTFKIRAINNKNIKGVWSGTHNAVNPAPGPVTNLAVAALPDAIEVSWTGVADKDLDRYEVYVGTTADFTPDVANRVLTGLSTRMVYRTTTYSNHFFKVRAVDKFLQSSTDVTSTGVSPQSSFTIDTTAPNAPTALAASITNNANGIGARAAVSWTMSSPPTDLAGFYVRYRKVGDTAYSNVTFQKDDRAGTIELQSAFQNYEFQIRAFDWQNNESAWTATVTATSPANTAPAAAPANLTSTPARDGIFYKWDAVADADLKHYELEFANNSGFTGSTTYRTGTATTLTIGGLAASTTYHARVRAVDVSNLASPWSTPADQETTLASSSSVSVSDLTGGTFGAIDMVLGPGANLIAQGGAFRSNTYGSTTYNAAATAGFFFNADNLHIPDGNISAKALKTGIISGTNTIELDGTGAVIQSKNYSGVAGSGGFRLNGSGLSIPDGTLEAAKVKIQIGQNFMPYALATMDLPLASTPVILSSGTSATISMDTVSYHFAPQSLKIDQTAATARSVIFASTTTENNIVVPELGATYIVSMWVRPSVTNALTLGVFNGATAHTDVLAKRVTDDATTLVANTWQRIYMVTTAVNVVGLNARLTTPAVAGVWHVDGLQIEKKLAGNIANTPSSWNPPSVTTIDGGMIKTGALISNQNTTVNGVSVPFWSIPHSGAATFADLKVRGNVVVGNPSAGADTDAGFSTVSAATYVPASSGWQLRSDGTADFLGITSPFIRGEGIQAGTLSPLTLTDGSMASTIKLNGILQAEGSLGEKVRFGAHGFDVWGPHEAIISTASLSNATGLATITTQTNHGYVQGSTVTIEGVSTIFDGTYTTVSPTTGTTITYAKTGFADVTQFSPQGAVAYGMDVENPPDVRKPQPIYVDFPSTIAKPNIISGKLQASVLTVSSGATFRGSVGIEVGTTFTIASGVLPPKTSPQLSSVYNTVAFKIGSDSPLGIIKDANGKNFVSLTTTASNGSKRSRVVEYSAAGTLLTTMIENTNTASGDGEFRTMTTFKDSANTIHYYVLGFGPELGRKRVFRYKVVGGVWEKQQTVELTNDGGYVTAIGWAHDNNQLLAIRYVPLGNTSMIITPYAIDPATGVIGAAQTEVTIAGTSTDQFQTPAFVARGAFDFGTVRYVLKTFPTDSAFPTYKLNYLVASTAGAVILGESWPNADNYDVRGAYWDASKSKFYALNGVGTQHEYAGGDAYWTDTLNNKTRWAAYSWYLSGTNWKETGLSPRASISLKKRATISATISPIPGGPGGSPDWARVYVANQTADPGSEGSAWKLRVPLGTGIRASVQYGGTTMKVNHSEVIGSEAPRTAAQLGDAANVNNFGAVTNPGIIQSTSGQSYWKGDDIAQFKSLRLIGFSDANLLAGNQPPLKIGALDPGGVASLDGTHLRIDGNEIIAMTNDSTSAELYLNQGAVTRVAGGTGGRLRVGTDGSLISNIASGGTEVSMNSSGIGVVTHSLNIPGSYHVFCQARENQFPRHLTVTNKNPNNFSVRVENASGAAVTGNVFIDWLIIGRS